jgi:hypothetical protein
MAASIATGWMPTELKVNKNLTIVYTKVYTMDEMR